MRENTALLMPVHEGWATLNRRFVELFDRIYPDCPQKDIYWAYYFLQAAMIHILAEAGVVDAQSDGLCQSSDLDTILGWIAEAAR